MRKHITPYSKFLAEQDLTTLGLPAGPAAPKKEKRHSFIFLDELSGLKRKRYPDGSVSMDFPVFSMTDSDLDKWAKTNISSTEKNNMTDSVIELRRSNVADIVRGDKLNVSNEDVPFLERLKNSLSTDISGRREPYVSIIFTHDGIPTTDDINITFIKFKT